MILSFSFEGCFLFLFRSFYRFFYDRIRKAAALQGGHHKVAAAIGQLFHVAAAHQSGGSFQLRAFAVCVRGIDAFQRLLDLKRLSLDQGKSWCKTQIEHKIDNTVYSASLESDAFILPIPNTVILLNPQWQLSPDERPFNPVMYQQ